MLGRRSELTFLASTLRSGKSCLIAGPPGMGKTRLVEEALVLSGHPALVLQRAPVLHHLLLRVASGLGCPAIRPATSIRLKAVVLEALRLSPRCIVLEDVSGADPKMYRSLQQLYYLPDVSLIVTAKSRGHLGYLQKLFWDPREEIVVKPLSRTESRALFEAACTMFSLQALDLAEFRHKVLAAANGNPGQILTICQMATRQAYQNRGRIRFLPLRIDALIALAR
jgi:predicted ATPase